MVPEENPVSNTQNIAFKEQQKVSSAKWQMDP